MFTEGKSFEGILNNVSAIVKDEDVFLKFVIRHKIYGDSQHFLDSFAEKLDFNNVVPLFTYPIRWKDIKIDGNNSEVVVKFDALNFEANLVEIKVKQKITKDDIFYTYDLVFIKKQDKDIDSVLSSYLKQKDENADGKKELVEFDVKLRLKDDE